MRSVKSFIAAGAATLLSSAAFAADMAIAPPPAYAPAPVVEDFGGWYLRGDIGFSNQRVDRLNNVLDRNNTSSVQTLNFNSAGIFGLGVGYKVNNWFRADVTGEYRGNSNFFGTDRITYVGGAPPLLSRLAPPPYHIAHQPLLLPLSSRRHHRLLHLRMAQQLRLDLPRLDPVPSDLHLLICSPHKLQLPITSPPRQVSRPI